MKLQTSFLIILSGLSLLEAGEYIHAEGTEYFISYPLRKNWFKAQRFCAYHGLYLLSVHSFEEQQIIVSLLNQFKAKHNLTEKSNFDIYTSANDMGHLTNEFYWTTTGHPFIYTNWATGYPTEVQPSNCITVNEYYDWMWININCANEYNFICQNRIAVPEVNRTNEGNKCQIE